MKSLRQRDREQVERLDMESRQAAASKGEMDAWPPMVSANLLWRPDMSMSDRVERVDKYHASMSSLASRHVHMNYRIPPLLVTMSSSQSCWQASQVWKLQAAWNRSRHRRSCEVLSRMYEHDPCSCPLVVDTITFVVLTDIAADVQTTF